MNSADLPNSTCVTNEYLELGERKCSGYIEDRDIDLLKRLVTVAICQRRYKFKKKKNWGGRQDPWNCKNSFKLTILKLN